jgi:predicted alpha/beta superfamily hydrolase
MKRLLLPAGSVLLLGCALAAPVMAQSRADAATTDSAPIEIGETFTIESAALGEARRINVYRPYMWWDTVGVPLPVMYMPDGGTQEDFLHVMGLLQVSVMNGTMRPFLLVGIENTERRRDLTGPTGNPQDREIAPRVGGSAAFRTFIRTELMPAIEARHATTGESAIVGESLAGLFIIETLIEEPGLFDTYIAFDPSLWWNDGRLVERAAERMHALRGRTIYLASSNQEEIAVLTARLAGLLEAHAPPDTEWHYEPMPEESHATIYHPAALRAFRTLFAPAEPAQ